MNNERLYLEHILRNVARVERLTASGKDDFLADEDSQAAVLYYLQTLAESSTRIDPAHREAHPEIPWEQIRGFRNIVVHAYLGIDLERVWAIIEQHLTPLRAAIEAILQDADPRDSG